MPFTRMAIPLRFIATGEGHVKRREAPLNGSGAEAPVGGASRRLTVAGADTAPRLRPVLTAQACGLTRCARGAAQLPIR
jgi:hypothetical protein